MKEEILKLLLSKTRKISLYNGGGEEETIIAFEDSLSNVVDEILTLINTNN